MGRIPENGTAEDEASAKYNLVALKQVFFIQDLIDLNPFLSILMFLVQKFTPRSSLLLPNTHHAVRADRVRRMRRRHLNAQRNFGCTLFDIATCGFRYVFTKCV